MVSHGNLPGTMFVICELARDWSGPAWRVVLGIFDGDLAMVDHLPNQMIACTRRVSC